MKQFILFIAILLALLLAIDRSLGVLMDYAFQRIRTGQNGGKINHYLSMESVPRLVILGSSRALHQVIPDSFKMPAFNLGHGGMFTPFQTGLLRMMEQRKKLPPILLLQIDPYEFMGEPKTREVQNLKYYYHQSDTLRHYIDELSVLEKYKYSFELYRYNGKFISVIKEYINTKHTSDFGNGYEMNPATKRDSLNLFLSAKRDLNDPDQRLNVHQFRYLVSFIEICKRNKVRLICFTSPIYKQLDYFSEGSREVTKRLHRLGIPYLNYTESLVDELQSHPRYWRDTRHLNHEGSKIFSGVLAKDVESVISTQSEAHP